MNGSHPSHAKGRGPVDPSETMVAAADVLGDVLASLAARGTPKDSRVRAALAAAEDALRAGEDPLAAIRATYGTAA